MLPVKKLVFVHLPIRQRWANSHSLSVSILSYLMDGLGLAKKEDVLSDLRTTKMKKNAADIKSIKQAINYTLNPFLPGDLDPSILYNIGSGKAPSSTTAAFLLNVNAQAIEKQNLFIEECHSNPSRFEMETIKRVKLHTFAEEGATVTKKKDGKVFQTRMERDLFARVLYIALQRKIDMGELLKYPLTPVPLSLCHFDGSPRTTSKSVLAKSLEKSVITLEPHHVDAILVDGFFFLHLYKELPGTLGRLAYFVLCKLCQLEATRIDVVFDCFFFSFNKGYRTVEKSKW